MIDLTITNEKEYDESVKKLSQSFNCKPNYVDFDGIYCDIEGVKSVSVERDSNIGSDNDNFQRLSVETFCDKDIGITYSPSDTNMIMYVEDPSLEKGTCAIALEKHTEKNDPDFPKGYFNKLLGLSLLCNL